MIKVTQRITLSLGSTLATQKAARLSHTCLGFFSPSDFSSTLSPEGSQLQPEAVSQSVINIS